MAKVFLSHQFTKEDLSVLVPFLTKIVNALKEEGHEVFCSTLCQKEIDEQNVKGYDARLAYCLERQRTSDLVLGIIVSANPSNGMARELELAKKLEQTYILGVRKELNYGEFRTFARDIHEYHTVEDLLEKMLPLPEC